MTRASRILTDGNFVRMSPPVRIAAIAVLVLAALLCPVSAQARDLVVYGEPTLRPVLEALGTLWRSRGGARVHVFVAPTALSFAQIERDARCDVIFALAGRATDEAVGKELLDVDSKVAVFHNSLVLVGSSVAPSVDLAQIIAGKRLAIADPDRDVAGSYGLAALRAAGIRVDPTSKLTAVAENSLGVLQFLRDRNADIGIVYASDAAAQLQFKILAQLDATSHPAIEYVAAQAANAEAQSDTEGFLAFLNSPEARAAFTAAGLTPVDEPGLAAPRLRGKVSVR